jgi:hypothetical protein
MSNNLNLHTHVGLPQTGHTNTGPERLVIGHPLPKVAGHGYEGLVVDRHVV